MSHWKWTVLRVEPAFQLRCHGEFRSACIILYTICYHGVNGIGVGPSYPFDI